MSDLRFKSLTTDRTEVSIADFEISKFGVNAVFENIFDMYFSSRVEGVKTNLEIGGPEDTTFVYHFAKKTICLNDILLKKPHIIIF